MLGLIFALVFGLFALLQVDAVSGNLSGLGNHLSDFSNLLPTIFLMVLGFLAVGTLAAAFMSLFSER